MTLFAFREVKSHEWTFYDPIKGKSETLEKHMVKQAHSAVLSLAKVGI